MSPTTNLIVTIVSLALGSGGLGVIINAFIGRKMRKAEVVDRLGERQLAWVQEFQEAAAEARAEAVAARREAAEVRRELAEVRREATNLARDLRDLRGAIMSPNATLERLRSLVGGNGPSAGDANGRRT